MNFKNINPVLKKSIIAFLLSIVCVSLLLSIYYLEAPGKILGAIIFTTLALYTTFEFVKPFEIPKWSKFIIPLSSIFIILVPVNNMFQDFIWVDNNILTDLSPDSEFRYILIDLIKNQFCFYFLEIPGLSLLIIALLIFIPCLFIKEKRKIIPTFFKLLIPIIIICFAIKFIFWLIILQFSVTLVMLFAVILTDTFSFFGGKLFGNKIFKKKLAPKISPNKTIEGALIGYFISCAFLFLIFGLEFAKIKGGINFGKLGDINKWILLFVVPIFTPMIAIIGDLLFSYSKRQLLIKDFSGLIPSHGGMLDRFDSTILVFFIFGFFIAFAQ